MKRIVIIVLVLAYMMQPAAGLAQTLNVMGFSEYNEGFQKFLKTHPDVTVDSAPAVMRSTDQLLAEIITGTFPYDAFVMNTQSFSVKQIMTKGYCVDLSSDDYLLGQVHKMYPSIVVQATHDDNLYGIPYLCSFHYYIYQPDAWEAAGLTKEDVPLSFTELLDFLETWIERIQMKSEDDICVANTFDEALYDENSYIRYLVEMLLPNYIMQRDYAGELLRFDTPEFRDLLTRCTQIGKDLYAYEPEQKPDMQLFMNWHGMDDFKLIIPLRMTTEQPILVKANLNMYFVNMASANKELAIELIKSYLANESSENMAYIYADALPVENPEYESTMVFWQGKVDETKRLLADEKALEPADRPDMEANLARFENALKEESQPENRYLISEDELASYRANGDILFFQAPSIFDPNSENGENVQKLCAQYISGALPLDDFVRRLDQLAKQIERERQ